MLLSHADLPLAASSETQVGSPVQISVAARERFTTFFTFTILLISFLLISWHRWASVVIDGGREMNIPLRLLNGETIYSQAYYLYGPLAPYINAFLYMIFGVHLNTLYAAGFICSMLILIMVFQ